MIVNLIKESNLTLKYQGNDMSNFKLKNIYLFFIVVFFLCLSSISAQTLYFDVTEYGAVGDGKTLCTESIQNAVDSCANVGGGTVYFPAGNYVTGPIFLKSNIVIHISAGATLLGNTLISDYPGVAGRWEGIDRTVYASMFTGHHLKNVSIIGRGTLNGRGEVWWQAYRETRELRKIRGIKGRAPDNPVDAPLKYPRPRMINLYHCENILIRDITIVNSPSWTVHPVYCSNITIDNISIIQPYHSPNTDGINPDSSTDIKITNCYVDVGDDCVTIKSGYNEFGRKVGIPCENVVVTNCTFAHGHGGIVVGSEMSGDVRNIAVSNCVFDGTKRGLRIKTARGRGGIVENFRASNLIMRNIMEAAFSITTSYEGADNEKVRKVTEKTPLIQNIHWSDIIIYETDKTADMSGLPEMPLKEVSLKNIHVVKANSGLYIQNAEHVYLENMIVNAKYTPALMCNKIYDLEINRFTTRQPDLKYPVIQIENVSFAWIRNSTAPNGTGTFLELAGSKNEQISMSFNRMERAINESQIVKEKTQFIQAPDAVQKKLNMIFGKDYQILEIRRDKKSGHFYYKIDVKVGNEKKELEVWENGELLN